MFLLLNVVSSMVSNSFKQSTMMASLFFLNFLLVFIIFFFLMMLFFIFVYRLGSNTPTMSSSLLQALFICQDFLFIHLAKEFNQVQQKSNGLLFLFLTFLFISVSLCLVVLSLLKEGDEHTQLMKFIGAKKA